jgi:hypothetical protein
LEQDLGESCFGHQAHPRPLHRLTNHRTRASCSGGFPTSRALLAWDGCCEDPAAHPYERLGFTTIHAEHGEDIMVKNLNNHFERGGVE